jgi:hypothetical protein
MLWQIHWQQHAQRALRTYEIRLAYLAHLAVSTSHVDYLGGEQG